jgi:hypothetical protein
MKTANNCDSFAGKNKSEHVLVSQLNTVLENKIRLKLAI